MEWFDAFRRDIPMRAPEVSPWGTLVFEVMSQQTPIPRVEPVWVAWMRRWPTAADLAAATPADVLVAWGRLGYPSRALHLQECARVVYEEYAGVLPRDYDALLELPGVGPYTASAVSSFAYHQRVAVLDTNVRRVFARWLDGVEFAPKSAPGRAERERANDLLPADGREAARWNVACMELGALVCTSRSPHCAECPLEGECAWVAAGRPAAESRPRGQAWAGTDRQARGRVMRLLRDAHESGETVTRDDALEAATLPGADPAQAPRVVEGLVRDHLIDEGAIRLEGENVEIVRLPT